MEALVKEALNKLSWPLLEAGLASAIDDACFGELLGHLRRCAALIVQRPDKARELRRDAFLAGLRAFAAGQGKDFAEKAAALEHDLRRIEAGYRGILTTLAMSPVAIFTPAERIAGLLRTVEQLYKQVVAASDRAMRKGKTFSPTFMLQDDQGISFNADGALSAMVDVMGMTLKMEAHGAGWFDLQGRLVLPALPVASEDLVRLSDVTAHLANWWRRWLRTETRFRYWGGELSEHDMTSAANGLTAVVEYMPAGSVAEELDYIANERLNDRLVQTFMEMMTQTPLATAGKGIDNPLPIGRGSMVSEREGHAAVSLCEILAYDILASDERPGGLRVVEWLRGYAVLHALAEREAQKANPIYLPMFDAAELLAVLERCGLSAKAANVFVNRVTFGRKSWDLFDHPLLRTADGNYLLFGAAIMPADLARITLSAIANLGVSLARKGKAFEEDTRRRLKAQPGLSVYAFKANRGGEEFEYDAVVVCGDYLFVLECKNRSLSGHDPMQAYYFDRETRSHVRQVQRLVQALKTYPDILETHIGAHALTLEVVPCVVNSLPFAVPGGIDGVYFTDASALKWFFENGTLRQVAAHRLPKEHRLLHRSVLKSYWEGDVPTPKDLLRQLQSPFQIELMRAHMSVAELQFGIGPTTFGVSHEYTRTAPTTESLIDFAGANIAVLRKERQMARMVTALRKKHERDQLVAGVRAGRNRRN
ncbi:MAG: nuclease-related domain-containing protein [Rhizomicrobium sp.]